MAYMDLDVWKSLFNLLTNSLELFTNKHVAIIWKWAFPPVKCSGGGEVPGSGCG